ncbi:MAG: hypothetical protein GY828_07845 [Candidatus Gracilibacteria bacterium]|nr:hypothetical protein [Candidatus Gracilibacteria bacterium]
MQNQNQIDSCKFKIAGIIIALIISFMIEPGLTIFAIIIAAMNHKKVITLLKKHGILECIKTIQKNEDNKYKTHQTYEKKEKYSQEPELLNAHLLENFEEDTPKESESLQNKYSSSKASTSTTFSSGKSIWDDYESVVPDLDNKKNKGK